VEGGGEKQELCPQIAEISQIGRTAKKKQREPQITQMTQIGGTTKKKQQGAADERRYTQMEDRGKRKRVLANPDTQHSRYKSGQAGTGGMRGRHGRGRREQEKMKPHD
jgi:hypothetical protein